MAILLLFCNKTASARQWRGKTAGAGTAAGLAGRDLGAQSQAASSSAARSDCEDRPGPGGRRVFSAFQQGANQPGAEGAGRRFARRRLRANSIEMIERFGIEADLGRGEDFVELGGLVAETTRAATPG